MSKRLKLFEGFGVELEYMIVDRTTMKISPVADKLIHAVTGSYSEDVERGDIAWSNELVNHVLELKTNGPAGKLDDLPLKFQQNIREINEELGAFNAMLLPTASHPFMDPFSETVIWPHENNEIYSLYDKIFDCRGHGWSNVQSTHLNLPFSNDEEFGRLHAAIRIILPIIPALSASSPVLDGKFTGFYDTRLEFYRKNQDRIPSICGGVIPERVYTESDYSREIFQQIQDDIRPYDPEGILKKYFLNSRGAIARFDRGAVEIRIIDIQEYPAADLAILEVVIAVIRKLSDPSFEHIRTWHQDRLRPIFHDVLRNGEHSMITDPEYLNLFGHHHPVRAAELWMSISQEHTLFFRNELDLILERGTLSGRIIRRLGESFSPDSLKAVYRELSDCLAEGQPFV